MNRELLEKPFSPQEIKQREGFYGKILDYIEGHAVIQRLNDSFDGNWSFEILEYKILEQQSEIIVHGKITAAGIVKSQFGSSNITRNKETDEIVSYGDDLKAAATDCLKKAATMLGVGLHLYRRDNGSAETHKPNNGGNGDRDSGPQNGNNGGSHSRNNGRLSNRQLNYIVNLAMERGINRDALKNKCLQAYGTVPEHLLKGDASAVIKELLAS